MTLARLLGAPMASASQWAGTERPGLHGQADVPDVERFADHYAAAITRLDPNKGETWSNCVGIAPRRLRRFEELLAGVGQRGRLVLWHRN
jgi:hypothetical protein